MTSHDIIPGKSCGNCGEPIPWRPGTKARENARYCSKTCRLTKAEFIPGKSCAECDGPIPWREGQKARNQARFCSDPCKFAWQRRPENAPNYRGASQTATCKAPGCGQEFSYHPSVRPNAEACSPACRSALHSIKMTGRRPAGGVYTSHHTFRSMARQAFRDQCSLCGWAEAPCDVAHIVSRKAGGGDSLDNVTMLCPNHHRMFDCGLIPVEEIRAARSGVLVHQ